jgi:hypothetical protein
LHTREDHWLRVFPKSMLYSRWKVGHMPGGILTCRTGGANPPHRLLAPLAPLRGYAKQAQPALSLRRRIGSLPPSSRSPSAACVKTHPGSGIRKESVHRPAPVRKPLPSLTRFCLPNPGTSAVPIWARMPVVPPTRVVNAPAPVRDHESGAARSMVSLPNIPQIRKYCPRGIFRIMTYLILTCMVCQQY